MAISQANKTTDLFMFDKHRDTLPNASGAHSMPVTVANPVLIEAVQFAALNW